MEAAWASLEPPSSGARATREAELYDSGRIWEESNRWVQRVIHVYEGPNTALGESRFEGLLAERAPGARVLEVGCAQGTLSAQLHALGARAVYGFDVSQREVEQARARYGDLPGVRFAAQSAEAPIAGEFDLIVGRAVLHHLDFRSVLSRLYEQNLARGGRMVFMEPMGHPLTLAFHRLVRSAHTPDEWPITPRDMDWLRERFGARVVPINLLSFPAGVFSSLFLSAPDNRLTRMADRLDRRLESRRRLAPRGRQGILVIDRTAGD